ncbi:hypothetical protein Tco_0052343 [Tanacetum coccineum]
MSLGKNVTGFDEVLHGVAVITGKVLRYPERILRTIRPTKERILDEFQSDDDNDDDDVEKDEEDGEEEEHLASADPSAVPTDDPVPSR